MLNTIVLDFIQHLEKGYCANHPDVIAGTKTQVVDRAVKQLLSYLQSAKIEVTEDADGVVLTLGHNSTSAPTDPKGRLRVMKADQKLQYYDTDAATWKDIGAGISDHTLLSNIGTNDHAAIDTHIASTDAHWPTPNEYYPADFDSHMSDTTAHNSPGGLDVGTNTNLTYQQIGTNRLIVVNAACQVSIPSGPDGMTCTIFIRNNIQANIYFDVQWGGGGIRLPSTTIPVTLIKNSSASAGDCIVLRSMTMLDCWVVQSLIGTWVPA